MLTSQVYTDKPQCKAKLYLMHSMQPHISRTFRGLKWTSILIGPHRQIWIKCMIGSSDFPRLLWLPSYLFLFALQHTMLWSGKFSPILYHWDTVMGSTSWAYPISKVKLIDWTKGSEKTRSPSHVTFAFFICEHAYNCNISSLLGIFGESTIKKHLYFVFGCQI